jgi:hypothetical protein
LYLHDIEQVGSARRTKDDTVSELRSQFTAAASVGGMTAFKQKRTSSGVKDSFQAFFVDQIFATARKKGLRKEQKQQCIVDLVTTFPEEDRRISPVWRIKGESSVLRRLRIEFTYQQIYRL